MDTEKTIDELIYLIALSKLKSISEIDKKKILFQLGSAKKVFDYCKSTETLQNIYWPIEIAKREIDFITKHAIQSISILDKDYPQKLIHIDDAPLLLYHKGKGNIHLPYLISIIGTRAHTRQSFAIIKDLIEVSVKNDDHLIKLATIAQRLASAEAKCIGEDGWLSETEKAQLLQDMEDTINAVEEKNKEKLTDIQIEIEEIKTKL